MDLQLLNVFYIHTLISMVFTFLSGLAYLQSENEGNEHFVIISYTYLIFNTFLVFAIYSQNYWSYYFSRLFYIITVCAIGHYIISRFFYNKLRT